MSPTARGFYVQAEDGIRDYKVTGVQTCALPISCLDFVSAALQIPGIVHVGSMTGTDTQYTDVADKALSPTVTFRVPLKVWKNHGRQDKEGKPYLPQFVFDGDLADTAAVQAWVLDSILPTAGNIQLD